MHFAKQTPRQYQHLIVTCRPSVMQEYLDILSNLSGTNQHPNALTKHADGICYMFSSGAKLAWFGTARYGVYCYADGGGDGLSALQELLVAESLRDAQKHYHRSWVLRNSPSFNGAKPKIHYAQEWVRNAREA